MIFLVLLAFVIGYQVKNFYSADLEIPKEQKNDAKSSNDLEIPSVSNNNNVDYSKKLKGKFVLKSTNYAGFEFIDDKTISWTNEMFPMDPDTMRLKWISKDVFVALFNKSDDKDGCPPATWVRKVESFDGEKLVLKNVWTGWGEYKDTTETFSQE